MDINLDNVKLSVSLENLLPCSGDIDNIEEELASRIFNGARTDFNLFSSNENPIGELELDAFIEGCCISGTENIGSYYDEEKAVSHSVSINPDSFTIDNFRYSTNSALEEDNRRTDLNNKEEEITLIGTDSDGIISNYIQGYIPLDILNQIPSPFSLSYAKILISNNSSITQVNLGKLDSDKLNSNSDILLKSSILGNITIEIRYNKKKGIYIKLLEGQNLSEHVAIFSVVKIKI